MEREVTRDLLDLLAQFQVNEPARRDRVAPQEQAEDVAGDRSGAIAVAGVVHRQ